MDGKGALMIQENQNANPKFIKFQYDPESLSRSFQSTGSTAAVKGESTSEAFRISDPPSQNLSLEIELDATDKLEFPDRHPNTVNGGLNSDLAALESLLYPKSSDIISSSILAALGTIEIVPPQGPSIYLIWGPNRVLPVSIVDLKINEEAFDNNLNPIRAKISLSLRVLSYSDIQKNHGAYSIFESYHKGLEKMASLLGSG
jgi:hypothetical protein